MDSKTMDWIIWRCMQNKTIMKLLLSVEPAKCMSRQMDGCPVQLNGQPGACLASQACLAATRSSERVL